MGDDSPRAHAHKKAHAGHLRVEHGNLHQLASFLLALSHGPKTTSINPGHHAFPTLLLPAEYSDFHRFCASVYHTFNFPDSVAGVVVFVGKGCKSCGRLNQTFSPCSPLRFQL